VADEPRDDNSQDHSVIQLWDKLGFLIGKEIHANDSASVYSEAAKDSSIAGSRCGTHYMNINLLKKPKKTNNRIGQHTKHLHDQHYEIHPVSDSKGAL